MKSLEQSALETAILDRFHELYGAKGFPRAAAIRVLHRDNTGGGRYVDLECDAEILLDDGYVDLGGSFVEMKGVPNGIMAVVLLKGGRIKLLELTVYGGNFWDGEEREWRIV